ncbi:hypothetical protein PCC8801_1081 [Rippkaea orientalis PCC 8801]|uniref:Uncharacterized protein n=1 Tax=Rippkaea orientalis (strain PCC 8801 / RF-1) TaxID=41431 RepID=B7K114_RIPO1|nr:hypothetical protein [Rippkaea orientalis]ACK65155.1 hypothetical protein PCC8801_1081 [Rippkaea orientalis PCC 8801]
MNIKQQQQKPYEPEPLKDSVASDNKIGFLDIASTVGSVAGGVLVGVGLGGPVGAIIGGLAGVTAGIMTTTSQHQKLSISEEKGQ